MRRATTALSFILSTQACVFAKEAEPQSEADASMIPRDAGPLEDTALDALHDVEGDSGARCSNEPPQCKSAGQETCFRGSIQICRIDEAGCFFYEEGQDCALSELNCIIDLGEGSARCEDRQVCSASDGCGRDEECIDSMCIKHECQEDEIQCQSDRFSYLMCEKLGTGQRVWGGELLQCDDREYCGKSEGADAEKCIDDPLECSGFELDSKWCDDLNSTNYKKCENKDGRRMWTEGHSCGDEVCSGQKGRATCGAAPPISICITNGCTREERFRCGKNDFVEKCTLDDSFSPPCLHWVMDGPPCNSGVPGVEGFRGCAIRNDEGVFCDPSSCVAKSCSDGEGITCNKTCK